MLSKACELADLPIPYGLDCMFLLIRDSSNKGDGSCRLWTPAAGKSDLPHHHLWVCRMRKSNSSCRQSCNRWSRLSVTVGRRQACTHCSPLHTISAALTKPSQHSHSTLTALSQHSHSTRSAPHSTLTAAQSPLTAPRSNSTCITVHTAVQQCGNIRLK